MRRNNFVFYATNPSSVCSRVGSDDVVVALQATVPSVRFLVYRIPCLDRVVTPAGIGTGDGSLGIVLCVKGADTDKAVLGEWPVGDGASPGEDGPKSEREWRSRPKPAMHGRQTCHAHESHPHHDRRPGQ
jgi:hypothetical protein